MTLRHTADGGVEPASFIWRGRCYRILCIDLVWKQVGRWWEGEGELTLYRVDAAPLQTASAGRYELVYRHDGGDWMIAGVCD